jgi:1-deoxy-D-xylulose-5-phosphate reductoisomerase
MTARQGVAILGSTGSIGTSTLRVLARQQERFIAVALTANANAAGLAAQVDAWNPAYVGLVQGPVPPNRTWQRGARVLIEAATHPQADIVLNAVVGAAGLSATLAALDAGKRVALANKETLVCGGALVTDAARRGGGSLVPVDSEHSAILQCLAGRRSEDVRRLIITASGGPFRTWSDDAIAGARVDDALRHPTWRMGHKITIDSATLANKALEVIEAHHLFGVPYDRIEVVVHPQSIVHSFVEFVDGSVLAQMGTPSMELPILFALTWPERVPDAGLASFDPVALQSLSFEAVRRDAFPMLALGVDAGRRGGSAPAVYNAANEVAVARFLEGSLTFGEIPSVVAATLDALGSLTVSSLEAVRDIDQRARDVAGAWQRRTFSFSDVMA